MPMIGISRPSGCHRACSSVRPTVDQATSSRWVCRNGAAARARRTSVRDRSADRRAWPRIYGGRWDRAAGRLRSRAAGHRRRPVGVREDDGRGGARASHRTAAHRARRAVVGSGLDGGRRRGVPASPRAGGRDRPVGPVRQLLLRRDARAGVAARRHDRVPRLPAVAHHRPHRPPHGAPITCAGPSSGPGPATGRRCGRSSGATSSSASRGVRIRSTALATRRSARIPSSRT